MKKIIQMSKQLTRISRKQGEAEPGMVTAEYALGTVATTGIAGILIWLSQQEWLREAIVEIFKLIISR